MAYFPMFVNIENKKVYVIGGGKVAKRKADALLRFGADVTVIAKEVKYKFHCKVMEDAYRDELIADAFMVVAATDDRDVNKKISKFCAKNNIYVNVADSRDESTFIFGASAVDGNRVISVSTSGEDPALAKKLRNEIREHYDRNKDRNEKKQIGS